MDGLEGYDGSLYRAWMTTHHPLPHVKGDDKQMRLSPVTYGQLQMLALNQANTLEAIRVMLARLMGDKRTKPHLIHPPSDGKETTKPAAPTRAGTLQGVNAFITAF
ncbi:hypothetical protein [Bifidobacterium platyrrhinorum]|uniref:Uncharacterized protein n=1 Tax=Bifidobacterium platyrrhinorum TaxID=2661628 RepID=A0A6L9SWD2_9BIFI|nr:hypothetical protein [Bifidobacterium platyrrhinorum]NEG55471.1 hypothetical protein [Bifidobacterium platyrrhinorum]